MSATEKHTADAVDVASAPRVGPKTISDEAYPGETLGLPQDGRGSLATWGSRLWSLVIDWAACTLVAMALFGAGVMHEKSWRAWTVLTMFFVERTVMTWLIGASIGQLVSRIGVARLDGERVGFVRAIARAAMLCVVVPALIVGPHRRPLYDVLLGTVVLKRR